MSRTRKNFRSTFRPLLESLESRQLLSIANIAPPAAPHLASPPSVPIHIPASGSNSGNGSIGGSAGTWTINATHTIRIGLGNSGASQIGTVPSTGTPSGGLDLTDSRLIVQTTGGSDKTAKIAAIQAALDASGATWIGNGITSTTISAPSQYGVGIFDNAQLGLGSFGGQSVDANAILVAIANMSNAGNWRNGDLTGDGVVNIVDFTIVAEMYAQSHPTI